MSIQTGVPIARQHALNAGIFSTLGIQTNRRQLQGLKNALNSILPSKLDNVLQQIRTRLLARKYKAINPGDLL